MKILFAIDNFGCGGASDALLGLYEDIKADVKFIVCKNNSNPRRSEVPSLNGLELFNLFINEGYDLIHWFRSERVVLFNELVAVMNKERMLLPIITTHCQLPIAHHLRLSPNEIKYSQHIIFITKIAYNHELHNCIPEKNKSMIYFGSKPGDFRVTQKEVQAQNSGIVFGRGSTLSKCHPQFLDWFNDIPIQNKKFVVIGRGNPNWIRKEISVRGLEKIVTVCGQLERLEWLTALSRFDIFLYQLPVNAHSASDYTIQHAMLVGKPVVYYGPESPKELIVHGEMVLLQTAKRNLSNTQQCWETTEI